MYSVVIQQIAIDQLAALQEKYRLQISKKIDQLQSDPRAGNNTKHLKGEWAAYWRLRSGDFRVIYVIDDGTSTVTVTWVGNRKDAPYD